MSDEGDNAEEPKTVVATPEPAVAKADVPRDQLVTTAVKFLQNPKVKDSPLTQKTAFLKNKGLTDEEVSQAIQLSNISVYPTASPQQQNAVIAAGHMPPPYGYPIYAPPPPVSVWTKAREASLVVIVVSGATYGIYQFFKRYVFPFLFGVESESQRICKLEKTVAELQTMVNQTLLKLTDTLQEIHCTLTANQQKLDDVLSTAQNNTGTQRVKETQMLQDLKGEIVSLKGLLLNRRSFPPAPVPNPTLPSWQLGAGTSSSQMPPASEDNEDNSESGGDSSTNNSPKDGLSDHHVSASKSWEMVKDEAEELSFPSI